MTVFLVVLNVLSLDALLVATVWAALVEQCFGLRSQWAAWAALGCCVCGIYSLDRLLDTREGVECPATVRHSFALRHRWAVKAELALAVAGGLCTAVLLGRRTLEAGAVLVLFVFFYFVLVHAAKYPALSEGKKELAVAVLFSSGVFLPAWSPAGASFMSLWLPFAATVALLWLNTWAITIWETGRGGRVVGWSILLAAVNAGLAPVGPFFIAVALSSSLLGILDLFHGRIPINAMRVAADFAVILPAALIIAL